MEAEDRFGRQLRKLFEGFGWRVQAATGSGFDFVAEAGDLRYAVQVKFAKEARRALLEGLLASAILRARAAANAVGAKPLAIVCAPSISPPC